MSTLAKKVAEKLAKNKAVQKYIAKEDMGYVLALALPSFLEENPGYLEKRFDLGQIKLINIWAKHGSR